MSELYVENFTHMSPVWSRIFPIQAERAEGCYIYSEDGNKYLDFTCGIGVTNTGHCHPKVVAAIREQAGLFIHAQVNIIVHKPMMQLIEELRTIVPPSIDGFFFSNSGAEAVEGAVKLARAVTGRPNVIVFSGSFHGRTSMPVGAEIQLADHAGLVQIPGPPGLRLQQRRGKGAHIGTWRVCLQRKNFQGSPPQGRLPCAKSSCFLVSQYNTL